MSSRPTRLLNQLTVLLLAVVLLPSCSSDDEELLPLVVFVQGRSMSKLPFVIAQDQGLYRKHGLDIEFQLAPPEFDRGVRPHPPLLPRILRHLGLEAEPYPDIHVDGLTPSMYRHTDQANWPQRIALASTDCSLRYYVVVRDGIETLQDLEGGFIGVNGLRTTSAFAALRLLERMGWDPQEDVTVLEQGRNLEFLRNGRLDAVVGGDETYEAAMRGGYRIIEDTRSWTGEELAGNTAMIEPGWLEQGDNREAAKRFLQALLEGIAIFHTQPELTIEIAQRWYGFPDPDMARERYQRADYVRREPFPCYQGIENTMRIHDSHAMRQYQPSDFYDDSLLRELAESGFIDSLYHANPR
jgi:ABC-type nitrate/sulfonate/bicarbonate transport system substrate-binding protein